MQRLFFRQIRAGKPEMILDMDPLDLRNGIKWALIAYIILIALICFLLGALLSAYMFEDMAYKERIIQDQNMTPDRLCFTESGNLAYCARFGAEDCQKYAQNRILSCDCRDCQRMINWSWDYGAVIA